MATQVGEATIKLSFDGKTLNASLANAEKEVESGGKKSGSKWANAWSVAAGNLISSGINKVTSAISNNIDNAIARVDTLNNFPKVMRNIGISGDEAEKAISKMADKLQGIPTNLDTAAAAVQRFTSKNSDVAKSTDMFLALNNAMLAGGMSTEMQATALEQISQSYAKGKPDMMEWRSLLQAMPAQARQLAIAMGFGADGIEDLGEALRKGDVTMDDFMNTVIQLNEQGIEGFDNFETQAKNATGGIQSAISIMNSRITQGISAVIDEIGSENITEIAVGIGNAFKSVGKT
ncbi:MAG: tape measure protein, partial [Bacteroidaceae bacterium]|nr:tape measure protein [Bacteroidaceae bacterium]